MVLLAYIAACTQTLRLGNYVVPVIARDPISLAKQASIVDVLSNGRLELGVGAGYLVEEADMLGHPRDNRASRLAETIEIMRKAWAEPVFEHRGRFWDIPPAAVRPAPNQADVPVWVGGSSTSALRTATAWGDGVLVPKATPAEVSRVRGLVPSTCRVAAGWHITGREDLASGRQLRDAGADMLIAHAGTEAQDVVASLRRLSEEVLPCL